MCVTGSDLQKNVILLNKIDLDFALLTEIGFFGYTDFPHQI